MSELTASATEYEEAVELARAEGAISVSFIQRRLSFGYTKALSIMEKMDATGLLGPAVEKGSPRRKFHDQDNGCPCGSGTMLGTCPECGREIGRVG